MMFRLVSDTQLHTYFTRVLFELEGCPGFWMMGRTGRRYTYSPALTSLPMFAKYARIGFHELPMNTLLIKLKDPLNEQHTKVVKEALAQSLDG